MSWDHQPRGVGLLVDRVGVVLPLVVAHQLAQGLAVSHTPWVTTGMGMQLHHLGDIRDGDKFTPPG